MKTASGDVASDEVLLNELASDDDVISS